MKRTIATAALVASIGLVAAGCGSSAKQAAAPAGYGQAGGQPGGQTARTPGGSGKVTDVTGSTAQVQSQDSQVAVSWTGSTTFTKEVTTDASAIKVGTCVTAFADPTTGTTASTDTVAATTVRIISSTDGTCTPEGGFSFGGGARGGAGGTQTRPTDLPTDLPSDRPSNGAGRGFGGGAIGKVTKVTSTGFTVAAEQRASDSTTAKNVTVTTSGSTVFSTTEKAAAGDVKVGVCVTSRGTANDTGAIAATTIAVSQPVDGACGFGGFAARPQS